MNCLLGETHKKIARQIALVEKFGTREALLLESGSTAPDDWGNFPHHKEKNIEILQYLLQAKELYLAHDDESYYKLGVAFHYIQDKWTLSPRLKDKHTSWEMSINSQPFLDLPGFDILIKNPMKFNVVLPTRAEKEYQSLYKKLRTEILCGDLPIKGAITFREFCGGVLALALMKRPVEYSAPILDLNFACLICLRIAIDILSVRGTESWVEANKNFSTMTAIQRMVLRHEVLMLIM